MYDYTEGITAAIVILVQPFTRSVHHSVSQQHYAAFMSEITGHGPQHRVGVTDRLGSVAKTITVKNLDDKAVTFTLSHVPTLAQTYPSPGPVVRGHALCDDASR